MCQTYPVEPSEPSEASEASDLLCRSPAPNSVVRLCVPHRSQSSLDSATPPCPHDSKLTNDGYGMGRFFDDHGTTPASLARFSYGSD